MGLIVEGGIYFLILFTPFAFGGVEMWAQGVCQIVTGLVVAAWVWTRLDPAHTGRKGPSPIRKRMLTFWICVALFGLFVLFQLLPLPPDWIKRIAPASHDLYSRTLPGYAEGKDFDATVMTSWLLARKGDRIPAAAGTAASPGPQEPPLLDSGFPTRASSWRTLTLYPFETRQRLWLIAGQIGIFAVVVSWFRSKERLTRLLAVAVFSGFALSMFGIIQKLTWNGKLFWVREGTYGNIFGPFVNRNSYAAFAGALLPVAVCMAFRALGHLGKGRPGALPRLMLWGFAMVAMCGGIFHSLSRGGILCTVLSLSLVAAMLLYYGRSAKELMVLGALGLAATGFLLWIGPEKVIERVGTLSEGQSIPSLELRAGAWRRSLDLIASSPFVGTGLGTFRFSFMRFAPPGEGWWTDAHNEYIELICDTGLIGAAICLVGLAAWLSVVARPWLFRDRPERYPYMGLVAGIAGLLVHSAVSSNLQVPANGLLLAVMAGALICLVPDRRGGTGRR